MTGSAAGPDRLAPASWRTISLLSSGSAKLRTITAWGRRVVVSISTSISRVGVGGPFCMAAGSWRNAALNGLHIDFRDRGQDRYLAIGR